MSPDKVVFSTNLIAFIKNNKVFQDLSLSNLQELHNTEISMQCNAVHIFQSNNLFPFLSICVFAKMQNMSKFPSKCLGCISDCIEKLSPPLCLKCLYISSTHNFKLFLKIFNFHSLAHKDLCVSSLFLHLFV